MEAALRDLPDASARWQRLDDGEQMSWAIEWSNEMARLEELARLAATGALEADEIGRYRQLRCEVNDRLQLVDALGLYRPDLTRG